MYKTRKSMQEIRTENRINEYALKGIGLGVSYNGGFWLSCAYINDPDGPRVRIMKDDVYIAEKWYEGLNEAEKYLVSSFIDNIRDVM